MPTILRLRRSRVYVFLSYRRKDAAFAAQALRYALGSAGHEVFLDTGTIAAGAAFREVIRDALERTDLVLCLVGPGFDRARLHEPLDPVAFELRQARFTGCTVHPVLLDGAPMPAEPDLPADLRWFCKASASALGGPGLGQQIDALVADVPRLGAPPRGVPRVLWVDDNPANNERERSLLRRDGIVFDNVVSTAEALEQLRLSSYDLVITDLRRQRSSDRSLDAGTALLTSPEVAGGGPPVIIYAGRAAVQRSPELSALGAFAVAAGRSNLLELVRQALGRPADPSPFRPEPRPGR
jgi:CheY-like chemotaxis protein